MEAAYDTAPEGTEYVIARYRDANANLRTQQDRIIRIENADPRLCREMRSRAD